MVMKPVIFNYCFFNGGCRYFAAIVLFGTSPPDLGPVSNIFHEFVLTNHQAEVSFG
ncbi:hypothetical protein JYU34_004422 [Plutella xylostella]|uniref:Uncharacterized protein n=1 Tax=Plutella xylostella TaxID=51655 RepID=A0ABQ7QXY6_PLUXY|nr:hypothetical protein JYU34_004422 [Plutella xylostella]